ncbi:MAG: HutD family protein [Prevotellaceae bacterium]|jgi:environmental stress-induced protein Ves|nr:HutD family protein [Prevotellaceae bacterium]
MKYKFTHKEQLNTAIWSGGTTTQLAIYPEDAQYDKHNFLWRISTATIETEESTFTRLPGINRIIMVLDGNMLLRHEGHDKLYMEPFRQKEFKGNWLTKSFGQATDFNVMMQESCKAYVEVITIDPQVSLETMVFSLSDKNNYNNIVEAFYFIIPANISLTCYNELINARYGDILMLQKERNENDLTAIKFFNPLATHSHIIRSCIYFND